MFQFGIKTIYKNLGLNLIRIDDFRFSRGQNVCKLGILKVKYFNPF